MAELTKAQIQTELDEAQERIRQMEKDLKKARAETLGFAKRDAGWLVTAPNSLYSGQKYTDITFLYGQTFIRENQVVPYFKNDVTPMSKGSLDAFLKRQMPIPPHTPADHKKYLEEYEAKQSTLAFSTSFRAVVHLFSDFNYKVERFEPEQIEELEARMRERENEARGIMAEEYKDTEHAKRVIKPGYFGQPAG